MPSQHVTLRVYITKQYASSKSNAWTAMRFCKAQSAAWPADRLCCDTRFVRLGTASLLSEGSGPFINLDKLDLRKYAARPCLARALCDYMLYHDHNPKRALELCAHATASNNFEVRRQLCLCRQRFGLMLQEVLAYAGGHVQLACHTCQQIICVVLHNTRHLAVGLPSMNPSSLQHFCLPCMPILRFTCKFFEKKYLHQ